MATREIDLAGIQALTFDVFGTVLDLAGSLTPAIGEFLQSRDVELPADCFWAQWRGRQRIEQYQDTIMMLGHSGYLETARRALVHTLQANHVTTTPGEINTLMEAWMNLVPFPEVADAMQRLGERYQLVVLSNGNRHFLDHLVENQIGVKFDEIISVDVMGAFKPHPSVYRRTARILDLEVGQCLMVSANSFDVLGAKTCGFRAAFVNRLQVPYEDSPLVPDITVDDFVGLAAALLE
ncbi:MAG: haloacid dehalogenase type II [Pirellulaceae bacterium]|nr:haloacid dehalogenase type II [Pirellulaceae bacterium]